MIHKTISLADQVFDQLETDILGGKYARGEVLTESRLSEELGVSRTPIREAVRRLEQEHIIEDCGKGMMVLSITGEDCRNIYEIRSRIEGLAAAACARNITESQLAELKEIVELQEFYTEKGDSEKVKTMDSAFHVNIYKFSGSPVFYDTLEPLHKKIQKYRKVAVSLRSRAGESAQEHRYIYEAIAAHDSKAAEQAMNNHIVSAQRHMNTIIETQSE
ncbi:MAG: GntR family transcriptional regulator [Oscillospiraceae bacterium]|nr:GntR family transcriptional regulator [Oscillospiraceae bacterium]